MSKARLLVELDVIPDQADAFVAMFLSEFVSRSRTEDGCEQYELWRDPANPAKMTIIEVWRDQAALDVHLSQSWFGDWAPKMEAMQATPLVVRALASVED
ncbi:putative quinol monooxygenase [Shimia abyssi]|uniref:Quinol monooxygenase YgiN n=1 Tax=Shimia abyssi TaxID=1662395 RepID=A0A2P8F665_9RHOB|nr:putative quinol monooxygenase [Shimia abyssi]PSL17210.1 quinol monooxygenase YgiN [Shimia abyssi]